MDITITWQVLVWAVGLMTAWTAFLIGIIKWLIGRMIRNLDERLRTNNDDCTAKWMQIDASLKQTDADLKRLMTQLPIEYQRREDSIREYTAVNSKLDRLYELLMELRKK